MVYRAYKLVLQMDGANLLGVFCGHLKIMSRKYCVYTNDYINKQCVVHIACQLDQ